ncbi:MAG TPA: SMC family ATPase [Thermoprotei archaeon]|nr:SMC family ATPase [Thermoprotei archaeon]
MPKLKIEKISVENFGSFGSASLDFSILKYPVIVLGDNGDGKTVFFVDSITYAFFKDAYGSGNISRKTVSRFHSGDNVKALVELESDDGASFVVVDKKVYESDRGIQYPSIKDLTGHTYDTLLSTYIVRQGKVSDFIEDTSSNRRNLLLRLLEHRFDKAHELVKAGLNEFRDRMESIRSTLKWIEGQFIAYGIGEVSEEAIDAELNSLEKKRIELRSKLEDLNRRQESIQRDIEDLIKEIENTRSILEIFDKVEKLSREIRDLEDEISLFYRYPDKTDDSILETLSSKIDELIKQDTNKNRWIEYSKELNEALESFKREFSGVDFSVLDVLRKRLDSFREERGKLSNAINMYRERIDKLSQEVSECPLCGAPLDARHRLEILEESSNKIKELESKIKMIDIEISSVEEDIRRLEDIKNRFEAFRGGIERLVNTISKELGIEASPVTHENLDVILSTLSKHVNDKYGYLAREFENLFTELVDMGFKIDREKFRDLETGLRSFERDLRNKYFRLRELRNSYMEYMEVIGGRDREGLEEKLKEYNERIEALKEGNREIDKEKLKLSGELEHVSDRINKLKKLRDESLKEYNRYREELDKLEEEYDFHKDLKEIFSKAGFRLYYLNNIFIPELNDLMDKYLSEFNSEYRVKFEASSDKLEMYVYQGRYMRDIKSLSGGEMTLLGLAFRLAFGELISKSVMNYTFDFLILDEALTHLDDVNKRHVVRKLVDLVNNGLVSQVIIITHDRTIQELPELTGSIVNVYREGSTSRIEVS